ncbi:MAG: photosynthetic complex putative assembly protein PuhB [Paracoccaceae bacterium]|nr:photosynthetic complex putative assembly protein PuhB [Paracoccaceae bacterium]
MSQDDFAFEPIRGLPERPPEGEIILWQGQPNWLRLTVESLNVWWVLGYFIFLFVWRFISVSDLMPIGQALLVSFPFLALAMIVTLLLMLVGYILARTTVYTITNKRVVMRIGAALTVTLNIPFTEIENAAIASSSGNFGSIAIDTKKDAKFSFLILWPHVRSWHFKKPKPSLRCIPDAPEVAEILANAAKARLIEEKDSPKKKPQGIEAVVS